MTTGDQLQELGERIDAFRKQLIADGYDPTAIAKDWAKWDAEHGYDHSHNDTPDHAHYMVTGKVKDPFGKRASGISATSGPFHSKEEALEQAQSKGYSKPMVKYYPPGTMRH